MLSRLAPGLQSLVLLLRSDGDGAAHMAQRLRAESQAGTSLTVFGGEFDLDDLVGAVVDGSCPATAHVSFWARRLLVLPIDEKVIGIEAHLADWLVIDDCAGWDPPDRPGNPAGSRAAISHPHSRYRQDAARRVKSLRLRPSWMSAVLASSETGAEVVSTWVMR